MGTLIGPFSRGYPVNFTSGGDTTREAFRKHIDEITKIYGHLNALDVGKVSASDVSGLSGSVGNINTALANHINSSNPHPNYTPSVSWSNVSNKPNLADLSGNLPMSRITGNLDASRINNLSNGNGDAVDKGDGITDANLSGNGFAKFNNGLMIQWGVLLDSGNPNYFAFHTPFTERCYAVNIQTHIPSWADLSSKKYIGDGSSSANSNINQHQVFITLCDWDKNGFIATITMNNGSIVKLNTPLVYIAIGK